MVVSIATDVPLSNANVAIPAFTSQPSCVAVSVSCGASVTANDLMMMSFQSLSKSDVTSPLLVVLRSRKIWQ